MKLLSLLITVFSLIAVPVPVHAQEAFPYDILGKVVAITDGDTVKVLNAQNEELKIRLSDIDAPEKKQPYGTKSKQQLSDLIFGKEVVVKAITRDRYGRIIGRITLSDIDVNAEMVRNGGAWVYRRYSNDQNLYNLEEQAKEEKKGLWGLSETQNIPPWEWRRMY